jgi:CRP-like cAMP-binding protein
MPGEQTPELGGDVSKPRVKGRDANRILAALPAAEHRRALTKLEPTPFRRGQSLYEPDKPISYVYFPRTGVASMVARLVEGGTIEVATIGNEGVVGLSAYLGNGHSSMEVFVQIPGEALREQRLARGHQPIFASPFDPGRAIRCLQPRSSDRAAVCTMAAHVP